MEIDKNESMGERRVRRGRERRRWRGEDLA